MNIYSVIGLALTTAIVSTSVREYNRQAANQILIAGGCITMIFVAAELSGVIEEANAIIGMSSISKENLTVMLKAVGLTYIIQLASSICKDLESEGMAVKVELVGKLILFSLCIPIMKNIFEKLFEIIGHCP